MDFENNNDYVVETVGDLLDKIESKQENYYQKSKNNFDYETYEKEMRELTVPFETTFEKEVYSDLTGERCVLMGLIQGAFLAQYNVLREKGHSPSEILFC